MTSEWQDISTAPNDGRWFLAYDPSGDWRRVSFGRNRGGEDCWCAVNGWWFDLGRKFTHWRPLPSPPDTEEGLAMAEWQGINRKEAWAFIEAQMEDPHSKRKHQRPTGRSGTTCWHYGKCELKDLLDKIYGPYEPIDG